MLTITTTDDLETVRARVAIVLQAISVATNVCVGALPHTLIIISVPRHADPEVWFDLPIHPDTPLAVAHHILHCLAFGNYLSTPESISDARFLLLAAHHLQSSYLWYCPGGILHSYFQTSRPLTQHGQPMPALPFLACPTLTWMFW